MAGQAPTRAGFVVALLVGGTACSDYKLTAPRDEEDVTTTDNDERTDPDVTDDFGETDTDDPTNPDPGEDPGDPADPGTISGRICDPSANGYVAGATVFVEYDLDGDGDVDGRVETKTDSDGNFTLEGVPAGTWTVVVVKGSFSTSFEVTLEEGGSVSLEADECLDGNSAKIAVISGAYDSVESILDGLGIGYDLFNGDGLSTDYAELLQDKARLGTYDIVFFNCGFNDLWAFDEANITGNLSDFVNDGGSVYASDWAYNIVEHSFNNAIEFYGNDDQLGAAYVGRSGELEGDVLDPTLRGIIGSSTADLNYDLPQWAVMSSAGGGSTTLIRGDASVSGGGGSGGSSTVTDSPLSVRFFQGDGQVIYTTFHNEQQSTIHMDLILEEIILSL